MHEFVCFNRQIISATEAVLTAASAAALYGKGVFTTVAVCRKEPFLWEKHWLRLNANAARVGLDTAALDERAVRDSLAALIEKNQIAGGRARITLFDESASRIWNFAAVGRLSFLITTADRQKAASDNLRLTISPFPVNSASPLAGVKSCNYLENFLALEKARAQGSDEAVRANERGEIVSGCLTNIFWLSGGRLCTPSLATGCLAGTTRAFVLENRLCRQIEAQLESLREADAIWLTSAGLGISRVTEFAGKQLGGDFTDLCDLIKW